MAVIEVNDDNFKEVVLGADKPVVLDFWAPWCGPCKMMAPVMEQMGEERDDVIVAKVNIDECLMTGTSQNVRNIPTFVVYSGGEEVSRKMGAMPKGQFDQWVNETIDA